MLAFKAKSNSKPLPTEFHDKTFRSYVDMANYADEHGLPDGQYFIFNSSGSNAFTRYRELTRKGGVSTSRGAATSSRRSTTSSRSSKGRSNVY